MHMSDALITPIVGGTMLASSLGVMTTATKKIDLKSMEYKVPYMGLVGAFVFASQMINFAIPGTGSSGHIGGGMLLAILLGPHAGFLTMASVLLIQALFFADGGLLAYGCNLFNLGFFTCYLAYPLVFKPIVGKLSEGILSKQSKMKLVTGSLLACVIGLQLGSLAVVLQTVISGRTVLPFTEFLLFMQPIHLAIGLVEGLITGALVLYLGQQNKGLLYQEDPSQNTESTGFNMGRTLRGLAIITVVVGVLLSQFASSSPDGLEWSLERVSAHEATGGYLEEVQGAVSLLPDYDFKSSSLPGAVGTGVSGLAGSGLTLGLVFVIGKVVKKRTARSGKGLQTSMSGPKNE